MVSGPDFSFPSVDHPLPSADFPQSSSSLPSQSPAAQFWSGSVFSTVQKADWNNSLTRVLGKIRFFQGKIQTHSSARPSHPPNDGHVIGDLNLFRSVSNSSVPTCVYFTFISEAHRWVTPGAWEFSFMPVYRPSSIRLNSLEWSFPYTLEVFCEETYHFNL